MDLNELLQQALRLTQETNEDTALPRVEPSLSEVFQATEDMHKRITQTGSNDLEANLFLGSRGVDLPKLTQKIESLKDRELLEPLNPLADTDVEGYLKNERENAIVAIIEETNSNVFTTAEKNRIHCMFANWDKDKEHCLNDLGNPTQEDLSDVRKTARTVLPQEVQPTARLNLIESLYARELTTYNEMRAINHNNQQRNLLTTLTSMAKKKMISEVNEMWNVLAYMTNVSPISRNSNQIQMRQTGSEFVRLALIYLEQCYKQYMNMVINKNRTIGLRGGIPSVYNTVTSFVNITFHLPQSRVGLLDVTNGHPLWPLVYYSLRSGDVNAAMIYLKAGNAYNDIYQLLEHKQKMKEQEYSLQNLETSIVNLEVNLKLEYTNNLRMCTDPYKKAVYAIVLACDPDEPHSDVVRTIDDFLWVQLSILSTYELSNQNSDTISYCKLQSLIVDKYGESYFNAHEKTSLYFQVLVLTGQFESAIEFLARNNINRPHAVHMAIALNELSMLGLPVSVEAPLLSAEPEDPAPMRRLNFSRLIVQYAKCFEQTDTKAAFQYYYLLRDFKTLKGRNLMLSCLCELLLDNYDGPMLDLIFGIRNPDETRHYAGGVFAKFPSVEHTKYHLASMVAEELFERTKYVACIELHKIAGDFNKALDVLSSLLSQVVHQPARPGSLREQLCKAKDRINADISHCKLDVNAKVMRIYVILSDLLQFFDYYHAGEWHLANDVLAIHRVIPNNCDEVADCVSKVKLLGHLFGKVLPDVLLAAMDIIYNEYKELKTENQEALRLCLRQRAKALTNMATALPNRITVDVSNRLLKLELLTY